MELIYLLHKYEHRELGKIWRQKNTIQTKEQDKPSEKKISKTEISNLPDTNFKIIVIKMLTELGRKKWKNSENFNKKNIYKI